VDARGWPTWQHNCPLCPAGFLKDEYTVLKDTMDRILASSVRATWKYSHPLPDFNAAFSAVKTAMSDAFYGPAHGGVYSPSVQYTLFQMGKAAIAAVAAVESVYLNMPNLHYLPCNPVNSGPFDNDIYVATSEPHGNIEATIARSGVMPHAKL
jgi:urate oxidase